jgi:hypothetical protein
MRRLPIFAWVLTVAVALFLLYHVKYKVESVRSQVRETARELESEREALHVVAAEWAYLNRPERLRSLADKYLSSSGVTVDQIAEIEAIPFAPQAVAATDPPQPMTSVHYQQ